MRFGKYLTRIRNGLVRSLIGALAILSPALATAEEWVLGVPVDDRPPLTYTENNQHVGLIIDIIREIGRRIDIDISIKEVGASERRAGFVQGKYLIECCIIPGWRTRPEEVSVQLFSEPVLQIQDIFIFPSQKPFQIPGLSSLEGKSVGTIRGYSYKGEEHFGSRVDYESVIPLLEGVSKGEVDVGIFQRRAAAYYSRAQNINLTFGPLHHEVQTSLRLHKSKADLMPRINEAIKAMRVEGIFKKLSDKHSIWMR